MKILCLIDNLGSGGAQRQLVTLGVLFKKARHDVRFLTYGAADFFVGQLQEHGIPVQCVCEPKPLHRIIKIRKALQRGDQDAVLSFLNIPNLLAELSAIPKRKWGLVVSERSANLAGIKSNSGQIIRQFHKFADFVVTNSEANRSILANNYPKLRTKLRTIYNTVDFDTFHPSSGYVIRAERRTRIVVAASYQYLKNTKGLVDAVSLLEPTEQDRILIEWYGQKEVVKGDTRAYDEAVSLLAANKLTGCVKLCGSVSDIATKIKSSDAVGLFSFYEGLPNAICEAMACRKPVIMSNVSDASILVDQDINGYLCDPHDPRSIADALQQVICASDSALAEMGNSSLTKARELFNTESVVGQYLDLLQTAHTLHSR